MDDVFEQLHNEFIVSDDFLSFIYELNNYSYNNTVSPHIYKNEENN